MKMLLAKYKYFAVLFLDMFLVSLIYLVTVYGLIAADLVHPQKVLVFIPLLIAVYLFYFIVFRIYRSLWQYAEIREFAYCGGVSILAGITYSVLHRIFIASIPIADNLQAVALITFVLLTYRLLYRSYRRKKMCSSPSPDQLYCPKKVLLVGAGDAGALLLAEIRKNNKDQITPIGFADDDQQKHYKTIAGISVIGGIAEIPQLCKEKDVDEIYICIPSATLPQRRRILDYCAKTPCPTKILPKFFGNMIRPVNMQENLRDISINDLLNREININHNDALLNYIQGRIVMVTGGGGSIGSELCRQIALGKPEKLIIVDIYENNAYEIQQELVRSHSSALDLIVEIASVRDRGKMERLIQQHRPNLIFHAAAHKHVPLMEHNPDEAVKNNVFGTYHMANLAEEYGVERFILISTDKAVHPSSFMGATKRLCEKIVQSKNGGRTEYVVVRFGNVLGSNGSVVPLFKKQIEAGGPVTVTHKDMERFFMTIPEAVNLVLQAGGMAKGGEIFVLNMGDPVKILSLAENMIKMMGYRPYQDIDIVFSGLRPGEKLYEELLLDEEGVFETENRDIFCGHQILATREDVAGLIASLEKTLETNDNAALFSLMGELIPSYGQHRHKNRIDGGRILDEVSVVGSHDHKEAGRQEALA